MQVPITTYPSDVPALPDPQTYTGGPYFNVVEEVRNVCVFDDAEVNSPVPCNVPVRTYQLMCYQFPQGQEVRRWVLTEKGKPCHHS